MIPHEHHDFFADNAIFLFWTWGAVLFLASTLIRKYQVRIGLGLSFVLPISISIYEINESRIAFEVGGRIDAYFGVSLIASILGWIMLTIFAVVVGTVVGDRVREEAAKRR